MKISENKFVSLAYTLTVDGQVADQATADRPLEFVYGVGMLLPKFEEFIAGKEVGDKFEFVLTPAEGYGEIKYANGDEYKGEWKADKRTGKGIYFKGPHDYVKGDFVDGKPHGLAIRYVNGARTYNGRWVEGKPQKGGIRTNAKGQPK